MLEYKNPTNKNAYGGTVFERFQGMGNETCL